MRLLCYVYIFYKQNFNLLYNGTRKGLIYLSDLRSNNLQPQYSLNQNACLSHLHQPKNTNHLLASDSNGQVFLIF